MDCGTHCVLGLGMAGLILCGKFYSLSWLFWNKYLLTTFPVIKFFIDGVFVTASVGATEEGSWLVIWRDCLLVHFLKDERHSVLFHYF